MQLDADKLLVAIPRIRGPIQLAGLLFSILGAALIQRLDPNNIASLTIAGAFGVAVVVLPLSFHRNVLSHLPMKHRFAFLILVLVLLLFSFGALAYVTVDAYIKLRPSGARFDSMFQESSLKVFPHPNGGARLQVTWDLFPLSSRDDHGATIFTGIVAIHDEDKIDKGGMGGQTSESCDAVKSCVGGLYFSQLAHQPVLVRSNTKGTPLVTTIDIKEVPKRMRIWWSFYQREGIDGAVCGFDNSTPSPAGGMPRLAMFRQGVVVGSDCYRSFGQQTFVVPKI